MSVYMNIERQPIIQRGNLIIDPQCYTVTLAGDKIDLYPKEFDVLCLWRSILTGYFRMDRFMELFGRRIRLEARRWFIT